MNVLCPKHARGTEVVRAVRGSRTSQVRGPGSRRRPTCVRGVQASSKRGVVGVISRKMYKWFAWFAVRALLRSGGPDGGLTSAILLTLLT